MNWKFWTNRKKERAVDIKDPMSFRESLDLAELPIVTFHQGKHKLNFLLDTGANHSVINKGILEVLKYTPSKETAIIYGIEGNPVKTGFAIVEFKYKKSIFNEAFQIMDMSSTFAQVKKESGVQLHGIIGNAFMQKYKYVLDFDDMIAYIKR